MPSTEGREKSVIYFSCSDDSLKRSSHAAEQHGASPQDTCNTALVKSHKQDFMAKLFFFKVLLLRLLYQYSGVSV